MEHSLPLLINYIQGILDQTKASSFRREDLSPDFRELGDKIALLADRVQDLTNQLQQKNEALELENQVLLDNIQAMDEISWALEQSNQELRINLNLVNALTDYTHNMIFVYSADTGQEVHTNQPARWFQKAHAQNAAQLTRQLLDKQPEIQEQMDLHRENQKPDSAELPDGQFTEEQELSDRSQSSLRWNMALESPDGIDLFYQVESFLIPWFHSNEESSQDAKKQAIVHIVLDETERQRRQNLIYRFAYVDPLTNLNNRRYATEKMEQWQHEGTAFLLSFIDVDYLKYCNDTFGHEQGDSYLIEVSAALQTLGGEVCRVGGDEFFLLQTGLAPEEQDEKLEKLRQTMLADKSSGYPKCFSYATTLVPAHSTIPLVEYISNTDAKMYQYKQMYKIPLSDVVYKDDRI
ncbi:GGDEF domain-containing protein [Acetatifactor muris]|uniref:Putative diguanylate cyclase YeaP n=1 Tax=Acetatifactor muris TaxID=879566 RepID=A0A2K4ZIH6_9FIRM|nr:GGDEF domain-containing protein [Acetatifactor muris]MCI8798983.1 GGDEF domain-containing protein [Lachnospiraceae bacterium]MCR2048676.1 GGDEF domain-containing protein [Acetatifactor muris]SOY30264.1 putative diguanylate cyclase YeaP [Acetatifactor muris]